MISAMKIFFLSLTVVFVVLTIPCFAQSGSMAVKIDSLETALQKVPLNEKSGIMAQIIQLSAPYNQNLAAVYSRQILRMPDDQAGFYSKYQASIFISSESAKNLKNDSAVYFLDIAKTYLQKSINQQNNFAGESIIKVISGITSENKPDKSGFKMQSVLLLISGIVLLLLIITVYVFNRRKKLHQLELESKLAEIESLKAKIRESEKQTEDEVNKRIVTLNEKLAQTKQKDLELKKTLKKAEDANYLKNAFLGIISHEIRTPLNGIIGFSSLLETELAMLENKELYEYAEGIQESGDRLLNLLNNIIDISKIEANDIEVDLHPCKIDEIVNNIFDLYVFAANEKGLAFKSKLIDVPQVIADNAKLMRVVHIIVDNAIKYTNAGFVNISTGFVPDSNEVLIRVKDTGVGIEANYQKHLFEAFRQESSGFSRSFQGAGLGLPLAKRLLDLMHGRIEINSMHNVGTTVDIYIPCEGSFAKSQFDDKEEVNLVESNKLDIFIVEDDRMNRMVLQKILQKSGHITMAVDGDETMKIISERYKKGHLFQVMLFDINLPSPWDGIRLMQTIRAEYKEYRYIPFIAQTAYAMAGDREKMLESGFDDYLAKPISKNELMTIIKNQLAKFKGIKS